MPRSPEKTLLIIDDSTEDVEMLLRAFKKVGVVNPIQVVHNGEDAMAYLSGQRQYSDREKFPLPALILLDIKMPGAGGFQLLSWLKQDPTLKDIVVIILTTSELVEDIHRAYQLGANSFLTKPVNMHELTDMVASFHQYWIVRNRVAKRE